MCKSCSSLLTADRGSTCSRPLEAKIMSSFKLPAQTVVAAGTLFLGSCTSWAHTNSSSSALMEKFSLCGCLSELLFFFFFFLVLWLFVLDHLSLPQRVYKQHCTVIPLSLIDLQTVIGESGLVVVSERRALDGCHRSPALSLAPSLFLVSYFPI